MDRSLYYKLLLNAGLHAGEAYVDGRLTFENSTLRDALTLFSLNRSSLNSYPLQKIVRALLRRRGPRPVGARRLSLIQGLQARLSKGRFPAKSKS